MKLAFLRDFDDSHHNFLDRNIHHYKTPRRRIPVSPIITNVIFLRVRSEVKYTKAMRPMHQGCDEFLLSHGRLKIKIVSTTMAVTFKDDEKAREKRNN